MWFEGSVLGGKLMDSCVMVVKVVCFEENSRELCDIVGSMLASTFIFHNHSMNRCYTFMVAEDHLQQLQSLGFIFIGRPIFTFYSILNSS